MRRYTGIPLCTTCCVHVKMHHPFSQIGSPRWQDFGVHALQFGLLAPILWAWWEISTSGTIGRIPCAAERSSAFGSFSCLCGTCEARGAEDLFDVFWGFEIFNDGTQKGRITWYNHLHAKKDVRNEYIAPWSYAEQVAACHAHACQELSRRWLAKQKQSCSMHKQHQTFFSIQWFAFFWWVTLLVTSPFRVFFLGGQKYAYSIVTPILEDVIKAGTLLGIDHGIIKQVKSQDLGIGSKVFLTKLRKEKSFLDS